MVSVLSVHDTPKVILKVLGWAFEAWHPSLFRKCRTTSWTAIVSHDYDILQPLNYISLLGCSPETWKAFPVLPLRILPMPHSIMGRLCSSCYSFILYSQPSLVRSRRNRDIPRPRNWSSNQQALWRSMKFPGQMTQSSIPRPWGGPYEAGYSKKRVTVDICGL